MISTELASVRNDSFPVFMSTQCSAPDMTQADVMKLSRSPPGEKQRLSFGRVLRGFFAEIGQIFSTPGDS
jgi:hypothetical protein